MTAHGVSASEVADRVCAVRSRVDALGGGQVRIVAVTKGFDVTAIHAAVSAGLDLIGENYAQEAVPKIEAARAAGLVFEAHFIGHVQSNKVRTLLPAIDLWQTVDRASLVSALAERAPGARVLVQVNSTGESAKAGVDPGGVGALVEAAQAAGLQVEGLMTMGPTTADPELARRAFRLVRGLVDEFGLRECSMGMSGDLEIAVSEGSTLIRVGTALFGQRSVRRG